MIIGGRSALQNIPVICVGNRRKLSTVLNGVTWVTMYTFTGYENLQEILAVIPVLTDATGVYYGIFDQDYVTDGQERWKSGLVVENDATDVGLDVICTPGNLLKVVGQHANAVETIVSILYGAGV